jgi:hypothetical protein
MTCSHQSSLVLLSRSVCSTPQLPYTAVLFFIGVLMGIGTVLIKNNGGLLIEPDENVLSQSIKQWLNINSRVLLLVFLPGLIYKDAYGMVREFPRFSFE